MAEAVFFNVWQVDSRDAQEALIAEMRSQAPSLAERPGFLGLTVWAAQDRDYRVVVEGHWASRAQLEAAVSRDGEAGAAHARLQRIGQEAPGLFAESFRVASRPTEATISTGGAATFVQVWEVGTPDRQEEWLATMREKVSAITGKPGFGFMGTHASADGKRIAVYAQWRDQASLEAAVGTPEAKAGHEALRAHGLPDGSIYRVADVFMPDRSSDLRKEAAKRWSEHGFESHIIRLDSVDLHVVTGGSGQPLVLLHGYPQSGEIWRFVAADLAKTHRVIIPDLRGMGLSGITPNGYDLPTVADDVHHLVTSLGLGSVDLAGHDWGGAVAAVYALSHRSEVRKLMFIESAVGGAGFENIWVFNTPNAAMTFIPFLLGGELAEQLVAGREEAFLRHLWNTFTYNKERIPFAAWQPYIDAMKRPGLFRSSASYYRCVYDAAERIRGLITEGKLTIPVLSVSGKASFGSAQEALVRAFADNIVRHVNVANSGHFVAEEQPEVLLAEFRTFFTG